MEAIVMNRRDRIQVVREFLESRGRLVTVVRP